MTLVDLLAPAATVPAPPPSGRRPPKDRRRLVLLRVLIALTLVLGLDYVVWRWAASLNWNVWWIAVPLVAAETYSLIDVALFALTMWRSTPRPPAPPAPAGLTVDVFVTTYDEPIELVLATARAAAAIRYPHRTWVLDDGARPELRTAAEAIGVGVITRSAEWSDRPTHAKAGNLNNALMVTEGEFLLVLDADQVPAQDILDRTLGYFLDPAVALVQTPQTFTNVPHSDPLGSEAPLFYGPIQQGKDGWNAAFFCGSNAVLRREALMGLGVSRYAQDIERAVRDGLADGGRVLRRALRTTTDPVMRAGLQDLVTALGTARRELRDGDPVGMVTYRLQQQVTAISRDMVAVELHHLLVEGDDLLDPALMDGLESAVELLAARESSPLAALQPVRTLLRALDLDRADEGQPLMPLATISVTEDLATAMRLHGMGWRSVYHHEVLARGLAPNDLGSMIDQRLRWAQGAVQVLLRENPLVQRGLSAAQRLQYLATAWTYLGGYATVVYLAAPALFLCLGILPVSSDAATFAVHFLPFMAANQLLFLVASRGISTWRGQQYSLALFPVWIRATTSAAASVLLKRPLAFAVTPKVRHEGAISLRPVRVQLIAAAVLVLATVIGVGRLLLGFGEPIGTLVNTFWAGFDLAALSVLVRAVRHRGFPVEEEH